MGDRHSAPGEQPVSHPQRVLTAASKAGEIELKFSGQNEEPAEARPPSGTLKVKAKYIGKSKFDYLSSDQKKPSAPET